MDYCLRIAGTILATAAVALLAALPALAYSETYMHLSAARGSLDRFELDLYNEDENFEVSFVETLPVDGMALVMKSGGPDGFDRDAMNDAERAVWLQLRVSVTPTATRPDSTVLFGEIFCRPSPPPDGYETSERGLLCLSVYDAGDAGEFFIVPQFSGEGGLVSVQAYFSVESQKVLDHEGTPDGAPFVGALLNGSGLAVDQSVTDFSERFANARPVVRLKSATDKAVVNFEDTPVPANAN